MDINRVAGCNFTLGVMSDDFVDVILGALKEVDQTKVWSQTDDVSTVVRGRYSHVFDVVKAIYSHSAHTGKHVTMSGTFGIGCNKDNDAEPYLNEDDVRLNEARSSEFDIDAGCKFAIYAVGIEKYGEIIASEVKLAEEEVTVTPDHFTTRLDGKVNNIFLAMENAFKRVQEKAPHTKITFTISSNSPSNQSK